MDEAVMSEPQTSAAPSESLEQLIEQMPLTPVQKQMVRSRWLDQVQYMSRKADQSRRLYYRLRFISVVGGVLVPALISISLADNSATSATALTWRIGAFVISTVVAVVAAAEALLRYGERWRHFRRNAELLKSEGWQYLMGIGPYRRAKDADQGFKEFSSRVEAILQEDIEGYMDSVARMTNVERHDIFTKL
jgi:hypothetical protein